MERKWGQSMDANLVAEKVLMMAVEKVDAMVVWKVAEMAAQWDTTKVDMLVVMMD